ncbi:hypothetical protein LRS06_05865 [Hymenobacter sp. J193]|uniref:hypothetical protein n=1 Tax=Hymenobacter sp. J193 TaxID=2898429 RepID=UPI002150B397|nr:hypothetical protein [Hymenobacter sp. J193]MCR5887312.1 hypothetical protein [Hymenobacter sp. J193]
MFSVLLLSSCQTNTAPETSAAPEEAALPPASSPPDSTTLQLQELLALYPLLTLPIKVSSQDLEDGTPAASTQPMHGRLIPARLLPLFGEYVAANGEEVFAVGKIPLPNHRLALLTRVPGEYFSSRIRLFVLTDSTGRISADLEVAETFGDAGDAYVRTSLVESVPGGLSVTIQQQTCHPLDEELTDIACVDSVLAYQLRDQLIRVYRKKAPSS